MSHFRRSVFILLYLRSRIKKTKRMNKTELLAAMSTQSDMNVDDCSRMLKSLKKVVSDELSQKLRRSGSWILLGIALLVPVCVFGQEKAMRAPVQIIRGIVIDGASRHPIPYATVQLTDKPEMGTVSDFKNTLFILFGHK